MKYIDDAQEIIINYEDGICEICKRKCKGCYCGCEDNNKEI